MNIPKRASVHRDFMSPDIPDNWLDASAAAIKAAALIELSGYVDL
jgi:hypothetical protein